MSEQVPSKDMSRQDALRILGGFAMWSSPDEPHAELRAAARAVLHDRLALIRQLEEMRVAAATAAFEKAESAPLAEPSSEELKRKLAAAGVFKGFEGLEGLLNASDFWEHQSYGTRLYYGPGTTDYLHRGVLETAINILKQPVCSAPEPSAALQSVQTMFRAAVSSLAEISHALEIPDHVASVANGNAEILKAIAHLKRASQPPGLCPLGTATHIEMSKRSSGCPGCQRPTPLSERLRACAAEIASVAENCPRELNRGELATIAARLLSASGHVEIGERATATKEVKP